MPRKWRARTIRIGNRTVVTCWASDQNTSGYRLRFVWARTLEISTPLARSKNKATDFHPNLPLRTLPWILIIRLVNTHVYTYAHVFAHKFQRTREKIFFEFDESRSNRSRSNARQKEKRNEITRGYGVKGVQPRLHVHVSNFQREIFERDRGLEPLIGRVETGRKYVTNACT